MVGRLFMATFIGFLLVIIVLLIIGLILRKRIYDSVDRLESWKLDVMERNVAAQLSKIKNLNLSGETLEKFEEWKDRWETIVTKDLAGIEEYLMDAEEAADRFFIPKAKRVLAQTEEVLQGIEVDIEEILKGLDTLIESAEESRAEVEELEPTIKELRRTLSKNRYQYGKAEVYFERQIDQLEEALATYHELVEAGNYFEAKELVIKMKQEKTDLEELIQDFPVTLKKCRHEIPQQLENLLMGMKEMKENGYRIEHLGFGKEINTYKSMASDLVEKLEKGETKEATQFVKDTEARIDEMYLLLEKEAVAKSFIESKFPSLKEGFAAIADQYEATQEEVEDLKKTYYLEDNDMEKYLSLNKLVTTMEEDLESISYNMESSEVGHSELRDQLEIGFEKLDELEKSLEEFKESIKTLRKDEMEARESLQEMRSQLYQLNRKLKKSNIPGVPSFIWNHLEDTTTKNTQVVQALERTPLDMATVQESLAEARTAFDQLVEEANLMLEQAFLTEQVIQYANRYRSKYPILSAKLSESERLFRAYEYEAALETAVKAVEEIEPGALKKIEETMESPSAIHIS